MGIDRRALLAGSLFALMPRFALALDVAVYVADGDQPTGPFDEAGLRERIKSRAEAARTLVWHPGLADWALATEVPALAALVASLPAETPIAYGAYVLGKWVYPDMMFEAPTAGEPLPRSLPGRVTWTFEAGGTYKASGVAEWKSIVNVPITRPSASQGAVPQRPIYQTVDRSARLTLDESGTYVVRPEGKATFTLELDGKATVTASYGKPEKQDIKSSAVMRVEGPDHMVWPSGDDMYRLSS